MQFNNIKLKIFESFAQNKYSKNGAKIHNYTNFLIAKTEYRELGWTYPYLGRKVMRLFLAHNGS